MTQRVAQNVPKKEAKKHACECASWTAGSGQQKRTTGCTATCTRQFAQGHDAKLVSFLVAAALGGLEVHDGRGTSGDPATLAARFGFAGKVTKGIERAKEKAQASGQHKPPEVVTTQPAQVQIKVGRWVYTAQIGPNGTAKYLTSGGATKFAGAGKYQVVES